MGFKAPPATNVIVAPGSAEPGIELVRTHPNGYGQTYIGLDSSEE